MPVIQDNWKHFNIIQDLIDRFSYRKYEEHCGNVGIEPKSVLEYAQKVGLLTVAEGLYPGLSPKEAYIKLFEEFSEPYGGISTQQPEPASPIPTVQAPQTGCGSCGGGKVR